MTSINQKEYLKKYLSIGKKLGDKKKKKKKSKIKAERLKIVDDDIDIRLNDEIKVDLEAEDDDAPQIVSIIDERPPSLRIDDKSKRNLWKPIGESDEEAEDEHVHTEKQVNNDITKHKIKIEYLSPPRSKQSDLSPLRKCTNDTGDLTPPRRHRHSSNHTPSPPPPARPLSRKHQGKNADLSPCRRNKKKSDDDAELNHHRRHTPRDTSPQRKHKHRNKSRNHGEHSRHSPSSASRDTRERDGCTPPLTQRKPSSRWDSNHAEKLSKTLDGKKAGLQQANDVAVELEQHKKREDEWFKNLSSEISGAGKSTIVRKKKTDSDVDPIEQEQKRKREKEMKEKYDRWGKGLKQIEDAQARHERDLHEMSKPLARYADDEDLENYLKSQEREGDPMLQYLRNKKRKKNIEMGIIDKPQYAGESHPNRFGIKPGHRWDGVDRSNGFEKRWFEMQNAKTANLEESYKWSTEDM